MPEEDGDHIGRTWTGLVRGGVAGRVRRWTGRLARSPGLLSWLVANQEAVNSSLRDTARDLADLESRLARIESRTADLGDEGRAGVTAVGNEIHALRAAIEMRFDALDRSVTGQAQTLQRAVAKPAREVEQARLLAELGPSPSPEAGLSVLIICWNHGGVLANAIAAGLTVLDGLPADQQGEVLVLDDASGDETPAVASTLAAGDSRVRVLTARANLGPARARNVLLHAVGTRHAFQLDADNTATPSGVAALLAVASQYGSAFTYGNILKHDADGNVVGYMSNEPLTEAWFRDNYIDTMALLDVERLRALGGWPDDPAVEHCDDWALVHRLARAGALIGFVPVVVGRYSALQRAFHLSVPDARIGQNWVARTWNADGLLTAERVAAFCAHPAIGPLWATPAAVARNPDLAAPSRADPAPAAAARPRLLVVGPGGVANLGDDAIAAAALHRLRSLLPDHDLDVVTDGPEPLDLGPAALWMGPLLEVVRGLRAEDLPANPAASPSPAPESDRALAEAVAITGLGRQTYRPVEPARYVGAVFVGGGNLTSRWTDTLVAPRAVLAAALHSAEIPYVMSGQGIGPLDDRGRAMARGLLEHATRCSLRDAGSAAVLSGVLGDAAPAGVDVTGDDALLLASAGIDTVAAALSRAGLDGRPYLAVTVRDADYVGTSAEQMNQWATAIDHLAAARGLCVLGVALNQHPEHAEVLTLSGLARATQPRRAPWRVLECARDPALLAGIMAGADAAVVHSYHAALFALRGGVPTVLMAHNEYYEQKAKGLAALADLPATFVTQASDSDDLGTRLDLIAKALANGSSLTPATKAVETWWTATAHLLTR